MLQKYKMGNDTCNKYSAVVIGGSAGGIEAISGIVSLLPATFQTPIISVLHLHPHSRESVVPDILARKCLLKVKEAEDKGKIMEGHIYLAPANYHLLIEPDETFALSIDEKVNFSRPSIDVLFESAADVYGEKLIGIVLTGASDDGSSGLKKIKEYGGFTMVQDPKTAESKFMPESAIRACRVDHVLPLDELGDMLLKIAA